MNTALERLGVVTASRDGVILTVDAHACRLFGYDNADDLVGRNVKILMPAPYREQHDQYLANYARSGVAKIIGKGRSVEAQHRDGNVFPIELNVSVAVGVHKEPVYVASLSKIKFLCCCINVCLFVCSCRVECLKVFWLLIATISQMQHKARVFV
jgi:PAS domain S-box-containing protein